MFRKGFILLALAALGVVVGATSASAVGCQTVDLVQGSPANAECQSVPHFKASFLNRIWKFQGDVNEVDADKKVINFNLEGIRGLPRRFATQDDVLLDQDVYALYKDKTRIVGPDGNLVTEDELFMADNIGIYGKLLAPSKWMTDDDGAQVPTVRAKRIKILSYVNTEPTPPPSQNKPEDEGDDGQYEHQPYIYPRPHCRCHPRPRPVFDDGPDGPPVEEPQAEKPAPAPAPEEEQQPKPPQPTDSGSGPLTCEHKVHTQSSPDGSISTWVEVICHH